MVYVTYSTYCVFHSADGLSVIAKSVFVTKVSMRLESVYFEHESFH